MDPRIIYTASTLLAFIIYIYLAMLVTTILMKVFGVKITNISLGAGPRIINLQLGEMAFSLGIFPFNASMQLVDNRFKESYGDPKRSFDALHPLLRFCIMISGVLLPLIAATMLFPSKIVSLLSNAFSQLFSGALSPFGYAQELIDKGFILSQSEGLIFATSVILVKVLILHLIPFSPSFGMGQALMAMRSQPIGRKMEIWAVISTLIFLLISISWLVALISYPFISK